MLAIAPQRTVMPQAHLLLHAQRAGILIQCRRCWARERMAATQRCAADRKSALQQRSGRWLLALRTEHSRQVAQHSGGVCVVTAKLHLSQAQAFLVQSLSLGQLALIMHHPRKAA
jgi:hypothetical protein